ncbi:MAG: hypothetical protein QMD71_08580 [bacterium]|nr:hypothetical protein [bacterium]
MVPVEASDIYKKEVDFWDKGLYGINFQKIRNEAVNSRYIHLIKPEQFLSIPAKLHTIDFYEINDKQVMYVNNSVKFIIKQSGTFYGLAGWFDAWLSDKVILSTSPKNEPTHWKNTFFPIQEPVFVKKGDVIRVKMTAVPMFGKIIWAWRVEINGRRFSHSTFKSIPIPKISLNPDAIPILAKEEEIMLFILTKCDGKNSIRKIAELLFTKYPTTYSSIEEALQKVKEVTRNCQILPVNR